MNFKTVTYFESTDYSIFKLLPFNREVDKAHVKTLVESMRLHGFKGVSQIIRTKIIDGTEQFYIVDGQHRIAAAKQLGLPIRFELTELKTKKETADFIAELNTSAKSWGTANFLSVWSSLQIEEYVKLAKVQKETGFQITPLLEAYLFTSNQVDYRKGRMVFTNEELSDSIVQQMIEYELKTTNKSTLDYEQIVIDNISYTFPSVSKNIIKDIYKISNKNIDITINKIFSI